MDTQSRRRREDRPVWFFISAGSTFDICCTLISICYKKIKFIKIRGCNDGNDMLICIRIKNNVAEILRIKTIKLRG